MKKNRMKFLIIEFLLLLLAVFFVWKIFDQNVAEPRIAVILPESGDKRWDALIKGMKQAAAENNVHMIICNTEEIDGPEVEREFIREQKDNDIDGFNNWVKLWWELKEALGNGRMESDDWKNEIIGPDTR